MVGRVSAAHFLNRLSSSSLILSSFSSPGATSLKSPSAPGALNFPGPGVGGGVGGVGGAGLAPLDGVEIIPLLALLTSSVNAITSPIHASAEPLPSLTTFLGFNPVLSATNCSSVYLLPFLRSNSTNQDSYPKSLFIS